MSRADLSEGRFWPPLPAYALVMAAVAMAHGLAVQWLLAPFPAVVANYAAWAVVVTWVLLAGWYGDAVIGAVARWEDRP